MMREIADRLAMTDPTLVAMGIEALFDYADGPFGVGARLGDCYLLAGCAFFTTAQDTPEDLPSPLALVHGSWHGPNAPKRIKHAWVLLDDGRVWEPITTGIFDAEKFAAYTRCERDMIYDAVHARRMMLRHQTFGPWRVMA